MQSKEVIYVLIPTYNHRRFISDAVSGALSQSVDAPLKIIIRDDASTDGTQEVAKEFLRNFPDRIRLIQNKKNQFGKSPGPIGAMLHFVKKLERRSRFRDLLRFSTRKRDVYVALCEGDDFWTNPNKLQVQISTLRNNKHVNLVHHAVNIQAEDLTATTYRQKLQDALSGFDSETKFNSGEGFRSGHNVMTCSAFFRLSGSNLRPFLKKPVGIMGDWVLFSLLTMRSKPIYLDVPMSTYRIHGGSAWSSKSDQERKPAEEKTREYIEKIFDSRFRINRPSTHRRIDSAKSDVNSVR